MKKDNLELEKRLAHRRNRDRRYKRCKFDQEHACNHCERCVNDLNDYSGESHGRI